MSQYLLDIGMMVRVFANSLGDLSSIPGQVIPKTQKMVLDASLLNTQHYKVQIKGKVEHSMEWSSTLPYTLAIEKGALRAPSTMIDDSLWIFQTRMLFNLKKCLGWIVNDISKKISLLYTIPMNINRYVPILINKLDTIVRGGIMLTK